MASCTAACDWWCTQNQLTSVSHWSDIQADHGGNQHGAHAQRGGALTWRAAVCTRRPCRRRGACTPCLDVGPQWVFFSGVCQEQGSRNRHLAGGGVHGGLAGAQAPVLDVVSDGVVEQHHVLRSQNIVVGDFSVCAMHFSCQLELGGVADVVVEQHHLRRTRVSFWLWFPELTRHLDLGSIPAAHAALSMLQGCRCGPACQLVHRATDKRQARRRAEAGAGGCVPGKSL